MKILFYGAGVLGSVFAAQMHAAGHDVSILARNQRLADLRAHGIVLEDVSTGRQTTTRVPVVERLAPEDSYDLVILFLRKNQIASVLPALAANMYTPNVLFMGNNVAGPAEIVAALGRERVLMGFAVVGGTRAGHVIRYYMPSGGKRPSVVIGEVDGTAAPRLAQVAAVFEHAGASVEICPNIGAWLKTHAAVVSPIANALYLAGGSNYRLAHTRDGVVLGLRAIREGLRVLRARGVPIIPPRINILTRVPEPILVPLLQRLADTEMAEIALAAHANAARDEMRQIADEFRALARAAAMPTPTIDHLYTYLDPAVPPVPEGSAQIPMDWRGIWLGVAALAALALALTRLARSGTRANRATSS